MCLTDNKKSVLIWVVAWCQKDDKPLFEPIDDKSSRMPYVSLGLNGLI